MPRQISIFLSLLVIFGMIQLNCQVLAQLPKEITNSLGMKLVLIPKGTFQMGSPIEEDGAGDDKAQHQVTISKDYYLGVYEVTQALYEKVMGSNPSYFQKRVIRKSDSSMYPVEYVSWEHAVEFCKKLSDLPEEKQVVCIACRQTQNGNTLAGQGVSRRIVLERVQNHSATMLGLTATATIRRTLSERRRQTLGAYTICTGTSGSGAATGTVIIPKVQSAILLDHVRARSA